MIDNHRLFSEVNVQLQHPLRVVAPTVDTDVLAVLARSEQEYTTSTLARMIDGRSLDGIRRALARLVEQGIVTQQIIGRTHVFTLNREHLATAAIIELALLRQTLIERIRASIAGWVEPPRYAALFGSAARGNMRPDSDIDIALVRAGHASAQWDGQVDALLAAVTSWTGNDARQVEFDAEAIRGARERDAVLDDIAREGVPLFGESSMFRRLIGTQ